MWCVILCDLQTSSTTRRWHTLGSCARNKKKKPLVLEAETNLFHRCSDFNVVHLLMALHYTTAVAYISYSIEH